MLITLIWRLPTITCVKNNRTSFRDCFWRAAVPSLLAWFYDRVRSGPGHPLPSCRSFTMFWKQNFRFRFNFLISYPQTLFVFTAQGISRNKYFIWYLFVGFVVILLVFLHDVSSLDCERELAARKQGQRHQYRTDVGTFWCGSTLLVLSKLYYWL